jgi:hypothetical protein
MYKIIFFSILFGASLSVASCSDGVKLYVAPGGDDRYPGTETQPLKSLESAKQAVNTILKEKPGQKVTVYFKGGVYPMEQTVRFTAEDSGSEQAPIVYRAAEGEEPIFLGSKIINRWTVANDTDTETRLAASVRGKVYVADLYATGITDFGDPTAAGKRPDLVCNGQLQTLARWPDENFVHAGKAKGATTLPNTYTAVHGTKEGVFEYTDPRQNRWALEHDVRLGGYWYWDWSDEFQTVDKLDTISRVVYLREPFHHYGYKDSLRYFGLNLFCEINRPGEWYLNRQTGKIYWYPPEGIDPSKAEVFLTCFHEPYMLEVTDCSYMTYKGLTFREGRGSAVRIENGSNNLLSGCRIERFGRDGVHVQGGTRHGISGCFLSTFGYGGIKIVGGDRRTLTPADHFVENTVVEYFSLFQRTYEPAVHLDGCGMRIAHNAFRYSSSSAMRLEGNDFLIEYNHVSHVVNESDDQGGIDVFYNPSYRGVVIRYNRWSDIAGGTRHGAAGIRFDDMISGMMVFGNLFERCGAVSFGAVQIHGGKDNIIRNNVFHQCLAAVSFSPWAEERWQKELENPGIRGKIYEEVDIRSELYKQKYPELRNDIRLNPNVNTIEDNLLIDCEKEFIRHNGKQIEKNNTKIVSGGKDFVSLCTPKELAKYGLQPVPVEKMGVQDNQWWSKLRNDGDGRSK